MKKAYKKPVLDQMRMEQENMLATSANNIGIFNDSSLGASQALSTEEGCFNIWE